MVRYKVVSIHMLSRFGTHLKSIRYKLKSIQFTCKITKSIIKCQLSIALASACWQYILCTAPVLNASHRHIRRTVFSFQYFYAKSHWKYSCKYKSRKFVFACISSSKVLGFLSSGDHTDYRSLSIVSEKTPYNWPWGYNTIFFPYFSRNWTHILSTKM